MMTIFQKQSRMSLLLALALVDCATLASAQPSTGASDTDHIKSLLTSLSHQTKTPSDALDPSLAGTERTKNLDHFSSSSYELNIVPDGGEPAVSGDTASAPVRVHYKAEDGNSLDSRAKAQFVRRNGAWYFANYDFMKWPAFLIVVLVVGLLVGISYAVTVLILWSRVAKQGTPGNKLLKVFIPLFWPSLFRQTR